MHLEKILTLNKNDNVKHNESIYLPELDGLRFFAFILVFISHHSLFSEFPFLRNLKIYSGIGVDLFFALSAYLFTVLLVAEFKKTNTISFKKFYIRRIFRIWPIYFLFVAFCFIFYVYILDGTISKYTEIRLIGLLTFSDNILSAIKNSWSPFPFTPPLWTIGYEEQFYIFIPIVILFLVRSSFKRKLFFLLFTLVLLNVIRLILIANELSPLALSVLPVTRFESIIMGIIIGFGGMDFLLRKINPAFFGFLGLIFFILLSRLHLDNNLVGYLVTNSLIGIITSLTLFSVLNSNSFKKLLSIKIFVYLGKRSYGLYVYHVFCIEIATYAIRHISEIPSNSFASFLYSLLLTILVSVISYKLIERPFLALKKKFEVIVSRPL